MHSSSECLLMMKKNILHLMLKDTGDGYRAKIILLKDDGLTVPEIRKMTKIIMMSTLENGYIV
jgi:hypothetical protein